MASTTATQQPIVTVKSGKMKRILLIVLGLIVLLGAGGAGAYYYFLQKPSSGGIAKPAPAAPPVFFPLESMTVNLQSDDTMHYLRIGLTLKLPDQKAQAALTERMPEVRSHILMLLSAKRPDDLAGIDGKRELAKELLETVQKTGGTPDSPARVQEVLFTEFVVQ
ncbi:flagellar basal body-associated protein FliL [Caballeronia sordidicola]|jgi:flagellar FliL protein|uniref:Flagellar protein FliL n=1 Tax=Caballeronia sordidicola TaxID=196367 RepID=A0A226X8P2_CABSO|nr:flagellar basal body-associated protein FliL [Caballeronia sordidicola]OXC79489.1 Flagellar biosynthesis protein FliL [Caballeronia sordidicola]